MAYYIVGIDFGDGETSANYIDIENDRQELLISRIKGNPGKITSSICKSIDNEWIISPESDNIKDCMSDEGSFEYNDCFKIPLANFLQHVHQFFFNEDLNTLDITGMRSFFNDLNRLDEEDGENAIEELLLLQRIEEEKEGDNYTVRHFIKFAKRVYANIIRQNNLSTDPCNFSLYAACPSGWAKDEKNIKQIYKIFLNEIGIPCEEVIEESRAAFMNCRNFAREIDINTNQNPGLLVIDFGSSTIDFTWYQGDQFYHNGIELGAHIVEKALFYYMIGHESVARNAFAKAAELFPKRIVLQRMIFFALRKLKEKFYNSVAAHENALLGEARLTDYSFKISDAAREDISLIYFGFDTEPNTHRARRYNEETIRRILNSKESDFHNQNIFQVCNQSVPPECCEYESKIITAFEAFKKKVSEMGGSINYVILTGGASVMNFIKPDIEEVFGVECNNTLLWDSDASYAVSKGIVQYGVFHHKSKPIIEKIENIFRERWLSENILKELIETKVSNIVHKLYCDKMVEVLTQWEDGSVGMSLGNTLNREFDSIINDGQNRENCLWMNIKRGMEVPQVEGCKSLHALYRRVFDYIDISEGEVSIETICRQLNVELAQEIHQEVGGLYQEYWEIYFPQGSYQDVINVNINLRINISFTEEYKLNLLRTLVERSDEVIARGFLGEVTLNSLNKPRNRNFDITGPARSEFKEPLKSVFISFSEVINPTIDENQIAQAALECRNQIEGSFQELQMRCTLATHDINNKIFDL